MAGELTRLVARPIDSAGSFDYRRGEGVQRVGSFALVACCAAASSRHQGVIARCGT